MPAVHFAKLRFFLVYLPYGADMRVRLSIAQAKLGSAFGFHAYSALPNTGHGPAGRANQTQRQESDQAGSYAKPLRARTWQDREP